MVACGNFLRTHSSPKYLRKSKWSAPKQRVNFSKMLSTFNFLPEPRVNLSKMFPKLQLPLPPFPLPTGHMKHHSRYQYRSQFSPKASELILPSIRLQPRNNDINLPSIRKVLGEFITTKEYLPLPGMYEDFA